ncbi:hypothetical protein [Streptomyces sp. NPDC054765]
MAAVQEAVLVSSNIERLQADTVMEVVDQLIPYSGGRLAICSGSLNRERLSRIAREYGMGYARFTLLTALFYAQEIGGFPFQVKAIEEIAGGSRLPDEPPRLSSDLALDHCADASMVCCRRSSRPPYGCGHCRWNRFWPALMTDMSCWHAGARLRRPCTSRCGRPWSGATSCVTSCVRSTSA